MGERLLGEVWGQGKVRKLLEWAHFLLEVKSWISTDNRANAKDCPAES